MTSEAGGGKMRCRVIYGGYVQGVCFRANTHDIAHDHAVVGYVRNLADGNVELEAEGSARDVEAFLRAVAARFARNIVDERRASLPVRGDEARFEIRY